MRKLLALFFISITWTFPVMSQTFVSDKQCTIAKHATKIVEYTPHERTIILDSIGGKIKIELLNGTFLNRNIKFVNSVYNNYGVVYDGYYETPQGEKVYFRNHEIGFHAMKSFGYFITYSLKGAKQPTEEDKQKESEQKTYESILRLHGYHDANCYKYKKIEVGIDWLTVSDIMDMEPIFDELFEKDNEIIKISVYPKLIIRFKDLKVDKVIKLK